MKPALYDPVAFDDYELLDRGDGEKLERFGRVVLRRPDPQALGRRTQDDAKWSRADLTFVRESDRGGRFESHANTIAVARGAEPEWTVRYGNGTFVVRPTPFKHVGLFPEQATNWEYVVHSARAFGSDRPRLLNLFGYTGVASVLAAQAGYEVTHVDASKLSIAWTRTNAAKSGLAPDALRVVLDDAAAFAKREVRRGARYHAVLLDPPHYGRGPDGEKWQFEDDIAELLASVKALLDRRALVVLSTYAIGCSPLALENLVSDLGPGETEAGELALFGADPRVRLPAGFCARHRRGFDV